MELLTSWLLFPVALTAVSLGLGLLLERAGGVRLPGVLLVPLGFAGALAACRLFISLAATARLALPVLILLALVGGVVGRERLRDLSVDRWALLAAAGVFLVSGAPVLLSGEPTFAGSTFLPDTSHQLALAAFLPEHGRDWESLAPSAHRLAVRNYTVTAYPIAPQGLLGVLAPLGLLKVAWLYQPFLSFIVALVPLCVHAATEGVIADRRLRGLVALVSGMPALVVSFAMQGSIKELATLAMVLLLAALVVVSLRERWPARPFISLAVAGAAALGSLGPAAAAYVAPLLALAAGAWAAGLLRGRFPAVRSELLRAGGVALVAVALLVPFLATFGRAFAVNDATLSNANDFGHLAGPLSLKQVSGIWLNGDFRYPPHRFGSLGTFLAIFTLAAAALGLAWMLRRRLAGPLVLAVPLGLTSAYLLSRGNAYADAKVLCLATPVVVMSAMLLAALLFEGGSRFAGALVGLCVAGGVLLSNITIYHEARLAPYERYSELLSIADELKGRGPTLVTEYDEFSEYLLHEAQPWSQPEWPHGYRRGALQDPRRRPSIKTPMDLDDLTLPYIRKASSIVIRRSPTVSRPPANYRVTRRGRYYDVWRPDPSAPREPVAHLALGPNYLQPGGAAPCAQVRELAARARSLGGRLAYVERPRLFIVKPTRIPVTPTWFGYSIYPGAMVPVGPGEAAKHMRLPGGRHRLWLEGSFGREVSVLVDGHRVGGVSYQPGNPGQYFPIGWVDVAPGSRLLRIVRRGGDLRPGNGGGGDSSLVHVGPLVFSPVENERRQVRNAGPEQARSLCGRDLDWIEVVV